MAWLEQLKRLLYGGEVPEPSSPAPAERDPDHWTRYDGTMRVKVVGESHYQEALMRVSNAPAKGECGYDCTAILVLDPDNPHDPKAVMVQVDEECVGYLPRGSARRFGKRLKKMEEDGVPTVCMAYIGRGPDHPYLGITLRIPCNGPLLS